jgi:hypothetical protein
MKTQHPWHHSMDGKRISLHVRFEVGFIISLANELMSNKMWHFSGDGQPFLKRSLKIQGEGTASLDFSTMTPN